MRNDNVSSTLKHYLNCLRINIYVHLIITCPEDYHSKESQYSTVIFFTTIVYMSIRAAKNTNYRQFTYD